MDRARRCDDHRPDRDDLIDYRVESFGGGTDRIDAGAINCIDPQRRTLWVERDRDAVRNGPAFDEGRHARRGVDVTAE